VCLCVCVVVCVCACQLVVSSRYWHALTPEGSRVVSC
jgi:hypothetical protein